MFAAGHRSDVRFMVEHHVKGKLILAHNTKLCVSFIFAGIDSWVYFIDSEIYRHIM